MTEEKWHIILEEERKVLRTIVNARPVNWSIVKTMYLDFIKAIDEATEVYNMENKGDKNV